MQGVLLLIAAFAFMAGLQTDAVGEQRIAFVGERYNSDLAELYEACSNSSQQMTCTFCEARDDSKAASCIEDSLANQVDVIIVPRLLLDNSFEAWSFP